jgi:beta-phosphoglucomutase-like phosphatase (HAD superfamily)
MSAEARPRTPAIIFDCDGVLADTERYGHLPAFNQMFAEFGLPVRWSESDYGHKLVIGGGKERLASLLTDEFVEAAGLPADRLEQLEEVRRWHLRKTAIYTELVRSGALPPRPGVRRVAEAAVSAGWELAVASTSAEESVRAVLEHAVGGETARRMHHSPDHTIVVEDSRNGLVAATAAGLACVVTVNGYTADESFGEAALVVTSLGDPDGEPSEVLENRCGADVDGFVSLDDLVTAMPPPNKTGQDQAAAGRAYTTGRS